MDRFPPILAALLLAALGSPALAAVLIQGADLSFLPRIEAAGGVYRVEGVPEDALLILRDRGLNTVRLRLWHSPADGASGLAESVALAKRVNSAGLDLLLDIHFSDTWADPRHQAKPAAWADLGFDDLADSVRTYTRDVLLVFQAAGAAPDIVQLGNEITPGMLWPDGRVGGAYDTPEQWTRLAALLAAGLAGLDEACPGPDRPEVMIHFDQGGNNGAARWFFDHLLAEGIDFDLIGLSYYPWWHGTLTDLGANLDDLAVRYGKDLVVVETAYPWTLGWFDDTHNHVGLPGHLHAGYPATPAGQKDFLEAVMSIVRDVPGDHGRGVFWWAPEWITAPGLGSGRENLTWFDDRGNILAVVEAFGTRSP